MVLVDVGCEESRVEGMRARGMLRREGTEEGHGETYVVFRSTMPMRAAATVEVGFLAGARAAYAALDAAADVDVGDARGVGRAGSL